MKTKTPEQIRAEAIAKAEKEIRDNDMLERVCAALGADLEKQSAGFMHVAYADLYVRLEADTLNDALTMAEKLNPLALYEIRGAFLTWKTEARITDEDRARSKITDTAQPWIYEIDGLRGRDEKTLICYVERAGFLVEVRIAVKSDPDTRRVFSGHYDREGRNFVREQNELYNSSGKFLRVSKFWSSPENPSRWVLS
jgi:hypothetical protein